MKSENGTEHGQWSVVTFGTQITALFRCPNCDFKAVLSPSHEIRDDGTVVPSIDCPFCDFHENVKLVGWKGGT